MTRSTDIDIIQSGEFVFFPNNRFGPYVLSGGPLIFTFSFFSQGLLVRFSLRHHLESYLAEFMWRKHVACTDVFESLLEAIATFWPPELQM